MVQLHSYPCIHKMNTLNLALTRFNILKSGGTSKNNEYKKSVQIQLEIMVSSTADSPHNDSHRHTENLYILTAYPLTGWL